MKTAFNLFIACFIVSGVAACKKDWTCTCTQSYSNNALPTSVTRVTIPNQTRNAAASGCEAGSSSGSYGGVNYTRNCELE